MKKLLVFINKHTWVVFVFFATLIFFLFHDLFNSYFEADEWFHFTYYFPLTRKPYGFFTALVSTFVNTGPLSGGQHVIPIASAIFFLNTKFFGLYYPPYAFMSLLLHSINSFLVFLFIKTLLHEKQNSTKNIFGILGGLFFALSPTPMHAVTGAAPFYGQNILSVTFFLLCILFFKLAFMKEKKKYMYLSVIFLFLALFTKETSVFLFMLLPCMAIIDKRIFPLKFLRNVFALCVIVYAVLRFVIPNIYDGIGPQKTVENSIRTVDTATIVSTDLSIHKNLPEEVAFRTVTFPIKMIGTVFFPRQTVSSIVQFITPIVYPMPSGGDQAGRASGQLGFLVGPGNDVVVYVLSIGIVIFCIRLIRHFLKENRVQEAKALATGLLVIILSALPLVAIVFSFPRWGYDTYFDSRLYYNPNVGAAIVFPFLLFAVGYPISQVLRIQRTVLIIIILFVAWLMNTMYVFRLSMEQFVHKYSSDRREVVAQLKGELPDLPQKAVFYVQTDGLSAYGPALPFNTSVPQALTVIYYDNSPLPDSFFSKVIFDGKSQGYEYEDGRGFGYYTSKKELAEALMTHSFKTSDIYAFYYDSQKVKLSNITLQVRKEMEEYKRNSLANKDWQTFNDSSSDLSFRYPSDTKIEKSESGVSSNIVVSLTLVNPKFSARIIVFSLPTFDIHDYIAIRSQNSLDVVNFRKVVYDTFHYNDAVVFSSENRLEYMLKLTEKLLYIETTKLDSESEDILERILGSMTIV